MKLLIKIKDSKAVLSEPEAQLLDEIHEIKNALKYAGQIKSGKLKARPAEDLLNEL